MNLKLHKPNYKADRNKNILDYCLFGKYIKKYKDKKVFTGGFGSNLQFKPHFNKKFTVLDQIEHKYEIDSMAKRYQQAMKQKGKNINKSGSCQSARFPSTQLLFQDKNIIKLNLSPSVKNCMLFNKLMSLKKTTKITNDSFTNSFGKMRSTSQSTLFEKTATYNRPMSLISLKQKPKKPLESYSYMLRKELEIDDDPFKVVEEDYRLVERNTLYERLRKENDLIPKKNHWLDKNKWKMFDHTEIDHYNNSSCRGYQARKYSLNYIKAVIRKHKNADSRTAKLINDLSSFSFVEHK